MPVRRLTARDERSGVELQLVQLSCGTCHSVTVNLHGATVHSWQANGVEMLLLSRKAVLDNRKAIRGGIPLVFPNFGEWKLGPSHGFARLCAWEVVREDEREDDVSVALRLTDNATTLAMWPHRFVLTYTLTLSSNGDFAQRLVVENGDSTPFSFTTLLHTYFRAGDVSKVLVTGLRDCDYVDKLRGFQEFKEEREAVFIDGATDRIYRSTPDDLVISGLACGRTVSLRKSEFRDTVVWNPGAEKAKQIDDLGDEEYEHFVCVESGSVLDEVTLPAHGRFEASQLLKVCTLS